MLVHYQHDIDELYLSSHKKCECCDDSFIKKKKYYTAGYIDQDMAFHFHSKEFLNCLILDNFAYTILGYCFIFSESFRSTSKCEVNCYRSTSKFLMLVSVRFVFSENIWFFSYYSAKTAKISLYFFDKSRFAACEDSSYFSSLATLSSKASILSRDIRCGNFIPWVSLEWCSFWYEKGIFYSRINLSDPPSCSNTCRDVCVLSVPSYWWKISPRHSIHL